MMGMTVVTQPKGLVRHLRVPNDLVRSFELTPNEFWLLTRLASHQSGVFAPSLEEIEDAGRVSGIPGMPAERALRSAFGGLVAKGYAQKRSVSVPKFGCVWVRSITLVPFQFDPDISKETGLGRDALIKLILEANATGKRRSVVQEAYERKAQKDRLADSSVVSLDDHRQRRSESAS